MSQENVEITPYGIEKVHEGAVAYEDVAVLAYLREAGSSFTCRSRTGAGWAGRHSHSARTSLS